MVRCWPADYWSPAGAASRPLFLWSVRLGRAFRVLLRVASIGRVSGVTLPQLRQVVQGVSEETPTGCFQDGKERDGFHRGYVQRRHPYISFSRARKHVVPMHLVWSPWKQTEKDAEGELDSVKDV